MDYAEFAERIEQMAAAATEGARRHFALETIRIIHRWAEPALPDDLSEPERGLLSALMEGIEDRPVDGLIAISEELLESMTLDPDRAISYAHDVIELMGVLDNWLKYRKTGDPSFVAQVAIGMVNSIDVAIQDSGVDDPTDDMLAPPEMREEFGRIQRLLSDA